ncbi:MAG: hypothetical protein ACP5OZ_05170 [Candidatus Woesearchaeota archaeon]
MENKFIIRILAIMTLFLIYAYSASALPGGPTLVSNTTNTGPNLTAGLQRNDPKGTITTMVLNFTQQNLRWKAYVGNISGKYALQDSSNYMIYEWNFSSDSGEIYATRASSTPTWTSVACAQQSDIDSEDSALNHASSNSDTINKTFPYQIHKAFAVGAVPINQNACRSTATFINNAPQSMDPGTTKFQEVLLKAGSAFLYTTLFSYNTNGYNNQPYDFQVLVAEDDTAGSPTTYYFYVELI